MAGTLFGLPLSQQHDLNGKPLIGALLNIYAAGTLSPATVYQDSGLSVLATNPLITDSRGRIPSFWLDDGSYRARFRDSSGIVQFDYDYILALGPSTGGGGGGGGGSVDPNAIASVGDIKFRPLAGGLSGWVRLNGRTIGSSSSGSTERANADTASLYDYLWQNFSDSICPVTSGRGANSAADFAANKPIKLLDWRGKSLFGLDDMGNTAAAVLTQGTPTAAATGGGEEKHTLITAELASHTHTGTTDSQGLHAHYLFENSNNPTGSGLISANPTRVAQTEITISNERSYQLYGHAGGAAEVGRSNSDGLHTHAVTNTSTGSGTAHNNMPPYVLGTWLMKL